MPKTLNENPFPNYTPRPGGAEYRTVQTDTLEGLKKAERLMERGWAVAQVGMFSIQFWRPRNPKERN